MKYKFEMVDQMSKESILSQQGNAEFCCRWDRNGQGLIGGDMLKILRNTLRWCPQGISIQMGVKEDDSQIINDGCLVSHDA